MQNKKEYTFEASDGKTTLKIQPVDIKNYTPLNDYVWTNDKVYIKCPKCGKVALVDTGMILTSNPPKYQYECKYCGVVGYMFTSKLYDGTYEQVTPSQEDKDLYEPPVKWSQESISINDNGEVEKDVATYTMDNNGHVSIEGALLHTIEPELKIYSHCEICGDIIESPAVSTGNSGQIHHICPDCAEKLRKLIGKMK